MSGGLLLKKPNIIMTSISNPEVLAICYAQGWASHADYMTKREAEAVTNVGTVFYNNTSITHFEEFEYFSVTSLATNAFRGCTNLTAIVLPPSVTTINQSAFQGDNKLVSINLSNVNTIGTLAFYNCSELVSVNISGCTNLQSGAFNNCTKLQSVSSVANIISMSSSSYGQFEKTKLSGSMIFSSFTGTTIPETLFASCSLVTDVQFPSSNYTSIGVKAFQYTGITSFVVKEGCTTLNNHSLSGSSFVFIDLPSTLTTWNGFAMYGNKNQEVIVSRATNPPAIGNTATSQKSFDGIPSTCVVYVPSASISAYEAAAGWSRFAGRYLPIEGSWYETHREIDPNES